MSRAGQTWIKADTRRLTFYFKWPARIAAFCYGLLRDVVIICVQTRAATLLWLRVMSKLLLVCTNSHYQLESGAAPTPTCCLPLLSDTCSTGSSDLHMHTHESEHTHTDTHSHTNLQWTCIHCACEHTFRCGYFSMQGRGVGMQLSFDRRGSLTSQE